VDPSTCSRSNPFERTLLVVEVKVDVTGAESTLRRHDEKSRLARRIARDRFGWDATSVSRLLVLPDASTPRRRIAAHFALFDRAYPLRGHDLRRWLRRPNGSTSGLIILSVTNPVGGRRLLESRRRVQRSTSGALTHESTASTRPSTRDFIDSSGEHQPGW
jgi:hypothetical protein